MNARLAAALLALVACSDRAKPAGPPPSAPPAALPAVPATPPGPAPASDALLAGSSQLVTAVVDDWTSTRATLRRWTRSGTGWTASGEPWPAVVGKTGVAWGVGLHGSGAAPGRDGPVKQEGDGKSPAGAFAIRGAYGYAVEPPKDTRLAYASSGRGDLECVDDPGSRHYTKIVDRKQVASDWQSAEQMLRDDALYTWVIDLAHNADATPRRGSCIFLHVWAGPESTTVGCTAMEERDLTVLLATLDPASEPAFVLLPRAEYQALSVAWGLPPQ